MESINILVINPGSTSTKISYFENSREILKEEFHHEIELLKKMSREEELEFRLNIIKKLDIPWSTLTAVVGRGGLLKPLKSGTYRVNDKMIEDLKSECFGKHASNFGGILAKKIASGIGVEAFIVDPVVVDEMSEIAKISGIPELRRKSVFHALNQKGVAKEYCKKNNLDYEKSNFIVAHMGGGISVGLHSNGEVVDVNNALDGDGPFTPERAGTLPIGDFFKLYYEGKYELDFLLKRLKGNGGLSGYMGTNNTKKIVDMIEKGDERAKLIIDAMCYQVSKEIGGLSISVSGKVDGIILTGGIAYSDYICEKIKNAVEFIGKVIRIPGEYEMCSLHNGVMRVLKNEEKIMEYI